MDWDDPLAAELSVNLQPLTNLMVNRYMEFLPKLLYPVRSGEHPNTAFGLALAYDYAKKANNDNPGDGLYKDPGIFLCRMKVVR